MLIYLSGKITGTTDYLDRFNMAEMELKERGFDVFNPTLLSVIYPRLTNEQYMELDLKALEFCDAIYVLKNYETSQGVKEEIRKAKQLGLLVLYEKIEV